MQTIGQVFLSSEYDGQILVSGWQHAGFSRRFGVNRTFEYDYPLPLSCRLGLPVKGEIERYFLRIAP